MSDKQVLDVVDFAPDAAPNSTSQTNNDGQANLDQQSLGNLTLDEMEKLMIEQALQKCEGNISKVAQSLGLSRAALYRRMEKHQLWA